MQNRPDTYKQFVQRKMRHLYLDPSFYGTFILIGILAAFVFSVVQIEGIGNQDELEAYDRTQIALAVDDLRDGSFDQQYGSDIARVAGNIAYLKFMNDAHIEALGTAEVRQTQFSDLHEELDSMWVAGDNLERQTIKRSDIAELIEVYETGLTDVQRAEYSSSEKPDKNFWLSYWYVGSIFLFLLTAFNPFILYGIYWATQMLKNSISNGAYTSKTERKSFKSQARYYSSLAKDYPMDSPPQQLMNELVTIFSKLKSRKLPEAEYRQLRQAEQSLKDELQKHDLLTYQGDQSPEATRALQLVHTLERQRAAMSEVDRHEVPNLIDQL